MRYFGSSGIRGVFGEKITPSLVQDIGKSLDKAAHSYNQAVGSMESRVLPSARKFKDLGVSSGEDIPSLEPTEKQVRELQSPELLEEDMPKDKH